MFAVLALLSALIAFGPASALGHSEGSCSQDAWSGTSATGQWRFDRYQTGSNYYDDVYGWVTYRTLYPCTGSGEGYSAIPGVNVEDNVAGLVFQVGIYKTPGNGPRFVYADTNAFVHEITGFYPQVGHRYEFRINKTAGNHARLWIYENGSSLWNRISTTSWTTNMKHGWWGWETENSEDMPGFQTADPDADLVGQSASVEMVLRRLM